MEKGDEKKTNSQKAIIELKEAIKDYIRKDKPIKSNTMKKFLLISGLMILISFSLFAQDNNKDFVVVGQVASDMNMIQIEMRYKESQNVYSVTDSPINPINQIASAISGKSFENLHIFVKSTPVSLLFNNVPITAENIEQHKAPLQTWKNSISGKVYIHCSVAPDEKSSSDMKLVFERITGMEFIITR